MRKVLAVAVVAAFASNLPAAPASADNCSDDPAPCSPKCIRLGKLYDQRSQAVERVYRKLIRNGRELAAAQREKPVNQARLKKLNRRDAYLRKLYDRRLARQMRTYRRLLACS